VVERLFAPVICVKFDRVIPKTFYFKNIARFEQLKDEVLHLDWSERKKDVKDPPLVVGGAHHLVMRISEDPLDKTLFQITFRIIDEPGYKETHPDLERMGRLFNHIFPESRITY
jgi:hypothetical protein